MIQSQEDIYLAERDVIATAALLAEHWRRGNNDGPTFTDASHLEFIRAERDLMDANVAAVDRLAELRKGRGT